MIELPLMAYISSLSNNCMWSKKSKAFERSKNILRTCFLLLRPSIIKSIKLDNVSMAYLCFRKANWLLAILFNSLNNGMNLVSFNWPEKTSRKEDLYKWPLKCSWEHSLMSQEESHSCLMFIKVLKLFNHFCNFATTHRK